MLCEIFEDWIFVKMLDWSTPGSTSLSKYVMTLSSECSIGPNVVKVGHYKKVLFDN